MLGEIFLFLFLGIVAGTFTGLVPGIHVNLVGAFLVFLSQSHLNFIEPVYFVVFIVSMSITHTFLDFIPSIFLGCPDTDTELSILPGHEMLKKGLGYEAIKLSAYGGLGAIFALVFLTFPSIKLISKIYEFLQSSNLIVYILIAVSIILILSERKKLNSLFVFLISGILGVIVLNLNFNQPLLPLLSGLFGSSSILLSIKFKTEIPRQKIKNYKFEKKMIKPILGAVIATPILSLFPAIGSGQSAVLGSLISKPDNKGFLVLLGATNTLVMGLSFVFFYSIQKTRTGSASAIQSILGNLNLNTLYLVLLIIILSGVISFFLTSYLGKIFSGKVSSINYNLISKIILIFLCVLVFLISGFVGFLVFLVSTIVGIYCISLNVKRTQMMGCLILPTIILYLF